MEQLLEKVNTNNMLKYYLPLLKKRCPKKNLISVIIPVMGRIHFLKPLIKSLITSIKKSGGKINITIVEHSDNGLFRELCKKLNVNYYWIKKEKTEPFNKSLCHNIGAILNKQSEYFLFHDLDCLVYNDFFINIMNKIKNGYVAFQTFKNRRLLYLSDNLTNSIIEEKISLNDIDIDINTNDILVGDDGAPGGSICVNREIFINVGGFDPELFFGYSPEDEFFWNKIEIFTEMTSTNNEILHMSHERLHESNIEIKNMLLYVTDFNILEKTDKIGFMNNKKEIINNFFI